MQVKQGVVLQVEGRAGLQEQVQGSNVLEEAQGTRISRSRTKKQVMDKRTGPLSP